jgi:hypothetical protein
VITARKLIAALAGSLALLALPPTAGATTIGVDTPGDGPSGCTLRNAIESADTDTGVGTCPAGSGDDQVFIATAIPSPLSLNSELVAGGTGTLSIAGPGAANLTVSGPISGRVLRVVGQVHVSDFTLANGFVDVNLAEGNAVAKVEPSRSTRRAH